LDVARGGESARGASHGLGHALRHGLTLDGAGNNDVTVMIHSNTTYHVNVVGAAYVNNVDGATANCADIENTDVADGRYFNETEEKAAAPVVFLGFDVAGKTGTAQVVARKSYGKEEDFEDNAWFVGFAPYRNPEIVVAAFVEHGGHGGTAAAPIAHAIFETYYQKKTGQFGSQANGPIAQVNP